MTWFLPPHPGVLSGQSDVDRPKRTEGWYPENGLSIYVMRYRDGGTRAEVSAWRRGDIRYRPERIGDYMVPSASRSALLWVVAHAATAEYLDSLSL